MPVVPAICEDCETIFPSGFNVSGQNITLVGNRSGPCPTCGGIGVVPDMTLSSVGNAFEVLWTTKDSLELLTRIEEIFQTARKEEVSRDELAKVIEEEVPELNHLIDILPKTRTELYAFLAVILLAIGMFRCSPGVSKDEVQSMIEKASTEIVQDWGSGQPKKSQVKATRAKKSDGTKLGRNDPCYCGSGKKYKHCHYSDR